MAMRIANRSARSYFLLSLPFLLAGFFAVRNLATWPARIGYSGDESYEGVALAEMIHLREGLPIYGAGAKEMFDAATYGPLFYLAGEHVVDPGKPSYLWLRLLSAAAIIGCAACCGVLAFWVTKSRWAAWLSPVVFLSYGMTTAHGIQALSDGVALFLSFLGFLLAYRFRDSGAMLLAPPLMVLGFYYKPQYIAGSLAVVLFLLLEKRLRRALEFLAVLVVCGVGMFAALQWGIFRGQAFWRHFLLYQTSLLSWELVGRAVFVFLLLILLPLIFSLEYLRARPNRLVGCYLLTAVVFGFLTYCKAGSDQHYYFESVLLFSVLFSGLVSERIDGRLYPVDLVLVLGVMLVAGQWATRRAPGPMDTAQNDALQVFLRRNVAPNSVGLALDPGELLQAGLKAPFAGLFQLAQLSQRDIVSDDDLVAEIRDHRFGIVLLSFDPTREDEAYWFKFYTPGILSTIEQDYRLETSLDMPSPLKNRADDRFYVYVPRNRGS